jgi:hypothetical protein
MPEFLTNNSIKSALAAASAGEKTYSVSDMQIKGLQMRVQKSCVTWSVRSKLHGKQKRYELGRVSLDDDGAGGLGYKTARNRAFKIKEMCENGISPLKQITAWNIGGTVQTVTAAEADKPVPSWDWDVAVTKFIDWTKALSAQGFGRRLQGKALRRTRDAPVPRTPGQHADAQRDHGNDCRHQ